MQHSRLAGRYAKSLVDLAAERNQLEAVFNDMVYLQSVCSKSREFLNLVKSPIITADQKLKAFDAVNAGKISDLTSMFTHLLIKKGREKELPEIVAAFIQQYKRLKEIFEVKLTTAVPVGEEVKNAILSRLKADTAMQQIELETLVDESLIGGFVLEMGDKLVDASILHDLKAVKKQFSGNEYLFNIR